MRKGGLQCTTTVYHSSLHDHRRRCPRPNRTITIARQSLLAKSRGGSEPVPQTRPLSYSPPLRHDTRGNYHGQHSFPAKKHIYHTHGLGPILFEARRGEVSMQGTQLFTSPLRYFRTRRGAHQGWYWTRRIQPHRMIFQGKVEGNTTKSITH